jgi:peptide/nickel transport system substrate-binding protein
VNKLYFGAYQPASGPLSPATVFAAPATETTTSYNPSLAAKLLDEAGWTGTNAQGYRTKDGQQLTVDWPLAESVETQDDITLAQQVQAEVKTLGIDLNITNEPVNQVIPTAEQGAYDILATGYSSVDANVLRTLFDSANNASPGVMGTNISRYTNPQVDQLLSAAEETTNDTQRAADYDQVQEMLVQQAAVFPVYVSTYTFAGQRSLGGVTFDSESVPSFYQAWLAR